MFEELTKLSMTAAQKVGEVMVDENGEGDRSLINVKFSLNP